MKIKINSLSDKKVKYKIYDFDGKKRKLLKKGKLLHSAEEDIAPAHSEITVLISRSVSPLSFLYVWFIQVVEAIADFYFSWHKLNLFFEINISNITESDEVNVVYTNATPERGKYLETDRKLGEPDALYCTTHPSKKITSFIRRQIWLETFIAGISAIAIIAAICLIYFKCIGAY